MTFKTDTQRRVWRPRPRSLWLVAAAVGLLVLPIAAEVLISSQENKAEALAKQFKVPTDWELAANRVEPHRFICLGDNPCPSVNRRWDVPRDLSAADLQRLIAEAGWSLPFSDSCEPRPNGAKTFRSCSTDGMVGDYAVTLTYYSPEQFSEPATLSLSVR